MADKVRVRYAPSPTGYLHIGNARTALFNYLFARHLDGDFIIRIEDTDLKRNIADGEKSQLENLTWLGMDWDEGPDKPGEYGPYRQSERGELYDKYLKQLLDAGYAYFAYDTPEELTARREEQMKNGETPRYDGVWAEASEEERKKAKAEGRPEAIRFRVPKGQSYTFNDLVKGEVTMTSEDISGDFVIRKSDGTPTYNFAVVVDDHLMAITHVLRGDDHVANTPKQLMLYAALGFEAPEFGHMSLITNAETGRKLSKRDGSILQFIEQYRDLGYLPEAMFNFIALLGWSPKGEEEIFSQEELIKIFTADRLSKSPAAFDNKKLQWLNNRYMKAADLDTVINLALPHLQEAGRLSDEPSAEELDWTKKLISLYKDEMSYGAQIVDLSTMFFAEELNIAPEAKSVLETETAPVVIKAFYEKCQNLDSFDEASLMAAITEVQKETGIKGKNLYMAIRVAASGEEHGPAIGLTLELLGRGKVLKHLKAALDEMA